MKSEVSSANIYIYFCVLCSRSQSPGEPDICDITKARCLHQNLRSHNLLHAMLTCSGACKRSNSPLTLCRTEKLIQWAFRGNVKHTHSDRATTHHPVVAPALPLAGETPVIRFTWCGWHVDWGSTARQHFVVYHRLKLQVFQLVGLKRLTLTIHVKKKQHSS